MTKTDKLFFYSKSAKVAPGKGANEQVVDASLYDPLGKDFRQVLSNLHVAPFIFEGYTYNTYFKQKRLLWQVNQMHLNSRSRVVMLSVKETVR